VLTFTNAPLAAPVEAIGPVRVELWARGSEPHFDLFARVCDVDPRGASWNVCDALAGVAPGRFKRLTQKGRRECSSTSGRSRTGLPPETGSGFRFPQAHIPAMCETRGQEMIHSLPGRCGRSMLSCSTVPRTSRR
jgi:X-Pro dipeptidyl-peptidase C-terminal non-catalytic domain